MSAANGDLGTPASFTAGLRPALIVAAVLAFLEVISAPAATNRRAGV